MFHVCAVHALHCLIFPCSTSSFCKAVLLCASCHLPQNNMRYPARPIRPVTPLADWPPQQQKPQQRQRPASTGRMGLRRSPAQQQQQPQQQEVQKQHAAACSAAAAAAAALLGEDAGRELLDRMLAISSMVPAQTPGQHSHNDGFSFSPSSGANASDGSSRKRSTVPPAVPAAAQGLYDAAAVKRERQVLVQEVTKETERKARSWSAPRWVEGLAFAMAPACACL